MDFSELTLRLLLIFFPGILCHLIVDALTVHKDRQPFQVFLFSYVYGLASYVVYSVVLAFTGISISFRDGFNLRIPTPVLTFSELVTNNETRLNFNEIAWVTIVSCVLALAISWLHTRKVLHVIATKLGATRKFGDANVWDYALNGKDVQWAVVRDLEKDMMYQGYVRAFSDVEETAEILLTNVVVYQESTAKPLYEADRIYLARKRDSVTLELPSDPLEVQNG